MSRPRFPRRAARQAGFTLVELMIAMSAGLVTVMGAYYLGTSSSRAFNEQMRSTETQTALRAAMEQLQRDVPRAGFLATTDSNLLPDCSGNIPASVTGNNAEAVIPTDQRLYGLQVVSDDPVMKARLTADGNVTRVDQLTMLGNYESGDVYKIASDVQSTSGVINNSTVTLETTRESFRRSFVLPSVGGSSEVLDVARFSEVFTPGRLVRIESDNHVFFRVITATNPDSSTTTNPDPNATTVTVSFQPAMPVGCFSRATALITPLSMIRYQVGNLGTDFARLTYDTGQKGNARVALIRSELDPSDTTKTLGSKRMVLDYAVEFQVDGVINTTPGSTPTWALATSQSTPTVDNATVAAFRALRITLSARTEEVDPRFSPLTRTSLSDPLLGFAVKVSDSPAVTWYARVRSLRTEIALPNFF